VFSSLPPSLTLFPQNGEVSVEDELDAESFMVDGANNLSSTGFLSMDPMPSGASPLTTDHTHTAAVLHHSPSLQVPLQSAVLPTQAVVAASPQRHKRRRSDSDEEVLLHKMMSCVEKAARDKAKKSSTNEIFGQYVASELDDIETAELQRWAKQQITSILYQAQSGRLMSSPS